MVQIQPVRTPWQMCVILKSLLNASGLQGLKAGSELSTNFRWWDFFNEAPSYSRLDLNHPPTPVGGICGVFYTVSPAWWY